MTPASQAPDRAHSLRRLHSLPELRTHSRKEVAGDEFKRAIPRVRCVSSTEACRLDLPHDLTPSSNTSAVHGTKLGKASLQSPFSFPFPPLAMIAAPEASPALDTISPDNTSSSSASTFAEGDTAEQPRLLEEEDVTTATIPTTSSPYPTAVEDEGLEGSPVFAELMTLPREEGDCTSSVDRTQPPVMTGTLTRKKVLFIDIPKPDDNELTTVKDDKDSSIPFPHRLLALRRRKRENVVQTSPSKEATAPEAIAISLNVHSHSTPKSILKPTPTIDTSARADNNLPSLASDTTDSPVTPTEVLRTPVDRPSPVRLGHPTRPYYSAIRKNGISPKSPRSTRDIPSPVSSPARRQSLTPSVAAPPLLTPETSRRLSMSTMFYTHAYASPSSSSNGVSVFSLPDDDDLANDLEVGAVGAPPTPAADAGARFSFSLPQRTKGARRFSQGEEYLRAQTISYARGAAAGRGYRGSGVGFSMSGHTELRMALAEGAASVGVKEDGFRFSATRQPAPQNEENTGLYSPNSVRSVCDINDTSRHGFIGRVRKLRKGLRDMLHTTSTNTS